MSETPAQVAAGAAASRGPLRIVNVTPRYLPHVGGVERHVHEVATRIAAGGEATITVLTTDPEGDLPAREHDGAVDVRRVRAHPRGRDWLFAPGIVSALRAGDWDVVHLQSYHTFVAPLAMATAAQRRIPYVVTFHGGGHSVRLRHAARSVQRRALRPLLRRAAALVAVAEFEIERYGAELGVPADRFVLIPNGVDLPDVPDDPGDGTKDPRGGPLIASVGRLERYKGHHRVLAAFALLLESEPQARLWIAGSGPYERQLRRLASDLGIGDRVEISAVAAEDRAQMARRIAAVDLVVLLSDFETHPIAALEALSLGRPLLVASGSGLGELADRGLARAIEPDAPAPVAAAAMLRELRDPLTPASVDLPTWDDCAAGLLELYRAVAGGRR